MIGKLRQKQTLASFDYQWKELTEGGGLLSDTWFDENVERIITDELVCLRRDWFAGKRVLDAGCGNGRWTIGLLRLGCDVTAVDASEHAVAAVEETARRLLPGAADRLRTRRVDLLDIPGDLVSERYDLVFSFGVLHHTGDTRTALANVDQAVGSEGVLFLYLYGEESLTPRQRAMLQLRRYVLAPLPFGVKKRLIATRAKDVHQSFDLLSPTISTRHTFEEVQNWLRADGFPVVEETIPHSELFVRALRASDAVAAFDLPRPRPPYWFDRYKPAVDHDG